jgi:hypothetical protein
MVGLLMLKSLGVKQVDMMGRRQIYAETAQTSLINSKKRTANADIDVFPSFSTFSPVRPVTFHLTTIWK